MIPDLDMPSARHFFSRQYWQRLRVRMVMSQFLL